MGICVQKTAEAEVMVDGGVYNIYISNEVVASPKLASVAALAHRVAAENGQLSIAVDSAEGVNRLAQAMNEARSKAAAGAVVDVFVEIDVGQGRCGVPPGKAAIALVHEIRKHPALRFAGLQAYHGKAQHLRSAQQRRDAIAIVADDVIYTRKRDRGRRRAGRPGHRGRHGQHGVRSRQWRVRRAAGRARSCSWTPITPRTSAIRHNHSSSTRCSSRPRSSVHGTITRCAMPATRAMPIDSGLPLVHAFDSESELEFFNGGDEHGILGRPEAAAGCLPSGACCG